MADNNANVTGLQLANLDPDTLKAPETRIAHAGIGRQIFMNMRYDDRKRNLIRARHQAMLDGEPPYDQFLRASKGQGALTNVNWGDAKAIMENFMSGIIDLNYGVESLMTLKILKQAVPDDAERYNYENILAQEVTRTIRNWEGYDQQYLNLAHWFGAHGVGVAYFEDDKDWRFNTTGLGDFVIPNDCPASEDALEVAGCLRYIPLHKMYDFIRNEQVAGKVGWNVEMVKKAMMAACPESVWNGLPPDWQRLQSIIRNNDIGTGYGYGSFGTGNTARTAKVALIHLWVKEFDQKVTKYVTTLNALADFKEKEEPWLYAKQGVYPEMRRGMMFFPYGIGDNGTYHAISGILRAIFPQVNAINRSQSQMLDAAMMSSAVIMQPADERSISRINLIPLGPLWIAPPEDHAKFIERQIPNVATSVMPVISDLRSTISTRAGQFQGNNSPLNSNVEKTRFQVAAELEALSKVGATQAKLWYAPWSRLMRETTRRMCRKGYREETPGGREVAEFRKRLEIRGFPLELLDYVDYDGIVANQAIGSGSGAARIGRLESLRSLAPEMDDIGRYNLNRDLAAAALGGDYDTASRYMPERPGVRPPIDAQVADLENNLMSLSKEPVIEVNQMHAVHLDKHIPFIVEQITAVEQGQDTLENLIEPMVIAYYHSTEHLQAIEGSEVMKERIAQYRQQLQQLGEFVINAQRKVLAERQRQMQQAQSEQQQQMDPALQEKAIAARLALQNKQDLHQLEMQHDQERFEMEEEQKARRFNADMARSDAKTAADLIVNTQKQITQLREQQSQKEHVREIAKMKEENKPKPKTK